MWEEVEVSPAVQRRVDRGWDWYQSAVPESWKKRVDPDDLDMGETDLDVLAQAFDKDSSDVLDQLDISTETAQDLGFRHISAEGKPYSERTGTEDDLVEEEYQQLTAAWYRKLTGSKSPATATAEFDITTAGPEDLLRAIEKMGV